MYEDLNLRNLIKWGLFLISVSHCYSCDISAISRWNLKTRKKEGHQTLYWGSVSIIQSDSYLWLSQNKQLSLIQWLSQFIILTKIEPGKHLYSYTSFNQIIHSNAFLIVTHLQYFTAFIDIFFIHIHMWISMCSTVYTQQIHTDTLVLFKFIMSINK